mmetsp:Transcript_90022/g.178999  ORF Transcript_90022/g.178999 Transcript_90022/m.178999 type:complete len:188 (-) Transcript_90022:111-674(-)|eukprot:CAMPEP_0172723970 /NCGR_PEP_ID=MMETSP1074-20121228/84903_1 /TAXON_ID=2916 /ORGANISM="Ceratium fusus, Strain PA161109" /LENGTH=187 /DNA_ID=CAMNT_0013550315 /DNA_START=86 /DNA_END=649 /DNA_ORIENTATION=+
MPVARPKPKPPISCCEYWVAGICLCFWAAVIFFAWYSFGTEAARFSNEIAAINKKIADNPGVTKHTDALQQLGAEQKRAYASAWVLMFLAIYGCYLAIRQAHMDIHTPLALTALLMNQFMLYITAGFRVGTSPWCNPHNTASYNRPLMSASHMFFIFSFFLAFVQIIMGFMRDALRERQRVVNQAFR